MNLSDRIKAFEKLGDVLRELINKKKHPIFKKIYSENKFFTQNNVIQALISISGLLENYKIEKWLRPYNLSTDNKSKNIGVFTAGNIPLVGFHDFLCVLILNNNFVGNLSSKDKILFKYVIKKLLQIEPRFRSKIYLKSNILQSDLFICTGNDITANFFEYKLDAKPKIIRKNKTSIAILNGQETDFQLNNLMKDIFLYFGLGCRNVSKIYLPKNYNINGLKKYFKKYSKILNHDFYAKNLNYFKVIYELKNLNFLNFESILLLESKDLFSPISVIYFEYYDKLDDYVFDFSKLQCVVSNIDIYNSVSFGKTQAPDLEDYADNIDTIDFLLKN